MPLPLIVTAALGLAAEYAPALIRSLAGDKAADVAEKVVGAAQVLTGTDTPDAAMEAMKANPELAAQFRTRMADLALEWERLAAADRGNARDREIALKDKTPAALAYLVTAGFFGTLGYMIVEGVPEGSEALYIMLGSLGTAWSGIVAYYFGSSAGSKMKTVLAGK